jgi:TnpA family transposase
MSQSVDTLTADALQDTSRWFLRDATLKAANTTLVNHHHGQTLSAVWGDGRRSSSDGQRFAVERKSPVLCSNRHHKYIFGIVHIVYYHVV